MWRNIFMKTNIDFLSRISSVVHDTFLCDDEISEKTSSIDIDGWDSLSHTLFIINIEQEFNAEISPEKAFEIENIGELILLLSGGDE